MLRQDDVIVTTYNNIGKYANASNSFLMGVMVANVKEIDPAAGQATAYFRSIRKLMPTETDNFVIEKSDKFAELFIGFLGVILGGRVGYVLFYQFELFIQEPLYLFKIWTGGMSFHGGLLGVLVAMAWFGRKNNKPYLQLGDFVAPLIPLGLAAGRLGNFINAELWGRTTDVPWGVLFPGAGPAPRHPSQLYEFALEGVVLFVLIMLYRRFSPPVGALGGLFLAGYGSARFFVEFYREPDAHLGVLSAGMSMGQWLSLPMIIAGIGLIISARPQSHARCARRWQRSQGPRLH